MDMDFRWGTRQPQIPASPVITEEVFNGNANAAAQAALAGAQAGAGFGQGQAYGNMLDAQKAKEAQDRAAVEKVLRDQADMQRWLELEKKYAKITGDPRMKMAAMLAMAGQPGALQQALYLDKPGANGDSAQKELDALESSIANDMFALGSLTADNRKKLEQALVPIYRSKFEELIGKGGKSRMGGTDWDSGWGQVFTEQSSALDDKRTKQKAAEEVAIAEFRGKFTEGSFGKDQSITKTASNGKTVTITLTPNGVRYSCGSTKSVK